jgi:iron complex outermembrane receptor protein
VFLELYSTRLGTATPNPDLGPERATNIELGWRKELTAGHVSAAVFYSDVRSLVQAVVLPDGTNQSQNVGDGHFEGAELDVDLAVGRTWRVGANYGFIRRVIADALLPNLRATGVPTHKGFLSASCQPLAQVTVSPSLELAGDRWSDINPAPAFPYVRTGAYRLVNVDATWDVSARLALTAGLKNASDDYYELAWGLPQPGRTFYVKTRVQF